MTNALYYIYSIKRFSMEIELLKQKFTIDFPGEGKLRIQYPNFVVVDLKLPTDYPRVAQRRRAEH